MKKKKDKKTFLESHPETKGLLLLGSCLVMLLSLLSFSPLETKANWLGLIGYGIGFSLYYLLGLGSYLTAAYIGWIGFKFLSRGDMSQYKAKNFYFIIFLISSCILLNLIAETKSPFPQILMQKAYIETIILDLPYPQMHIRYNLGGVPLYYLFRDLPTVNLQHLLSNVGTGITFTVIAMVSALLFTETRVFVLWEKIKNILSVCKEFLIRLSKPATKKTVITPNPDRIEEKLTSQYPDPIFPPKQERKKPLFKSKPNPLSKVQKRKLALEAQKVVNGDFKGFRLPPSTLLRDPRKIDQPSLKKDLKRQADLLEETLLSFGIEAKVGEIHCGPTIVSFEVHPAVGVKVQKIKALSNDIALNLQAKSIRIIAPIPGKAAVGIEIPSLYPQEVGFKELLYTYKHSKKKFHIPVLLGKTVSGETVMSDLAKMPHCIIAGATGSGKSVCINTIIMSIVMNAKPDEVKLLMVDPKKVELTGYTNLPHMIAPVITEAHGAYAALSWLVKEMQKRYDILKQLGLRNIEAFNSRRPDKAFEESLTMEIPEKMHMIVAIIDEFADLMMASSSDLETPIARIAQMARAVGIHLILATQRPSREVITGLIKANFPTRISFKVASRINSQIILDETGAENLLGNGDMLFLPPGSSHLIRAQGTYISDEEIREIIDYICKQTPTKYLIPSFDVMPREEMQLLTEPADKSRDNLYDQALSIVTQTGTASTTFLQRKLKMGYARAASLMDELEANGIISPQEGAKPRRVLITTAKSEGD